jgi:hypothetical protein
MWNDFNNSDNQQSFDVIPNNTLAKVRMQIRPGGYDDTNQGWNGGYATKNDNTGSIYLSCEFVVLEGEFARRKVWSLIGLHSNKGPEWANIGRSFIKAILNSSKGFKESDVSEAAQNARRIKGLADLDGVEFLAKITVAKDQNGNDKNEIKFAITPDHKDYTKLMGNVSHNLQQSQPTQTQQPNNNRQANNRPTWAQ